jgi:16S rRNA (cytosine967-C5)-methyltransferase
VVDDSSGFHCREYLGNIHAGVRCIHTIRRHLVDSFYNGSCAHLKSSHYVNRYEPMNVTAISPARTAAFDVLMRVEQQDAYASELLHSSQYAKLSPADHGLATELVMGVLRWRAVLDLRIEQASAQALRRLDLEVLTALRLGAYQLGWLQRVPARAAIHESVELVKRSRKRSAAPFVNAVLRNISAAPVERAAPGRSVSKIASGYAHPDWLVERWGSFFGVEIAQAICAFDQQVPQTAIRLNTPDAEQQLLADNIKLAPGELLSSARRVLSGDVTRTQVYRRGQISIQDEASQLVALLVGKGARILDCCAAPGGKTAVLARRNPDSEVVAVELHPHRARLLRKLVGAPNVSVVAADARHLPLAGPFDRVLVDVPCSGTGTLSRHPEIKWRLTPDDLSDLQARQTEILKSAIMHVAPGGQLVYSTCSLEPEENEQVIERVLHADSSLGVLDCRERLEELHSEGELKALDFESLTSGPYLRTIPGVQHCDGFFAAILKKK